ncbi:menaquinone biosynthesis protein [bacterium]|nr:menaquinone biosynthesis protein [bacterium]
MGTLRVGVIAFVNTLPLTRGLEKSRSPEVELVYASPSALADRLRYGELDAALIPAVEFFRGVGAGIVPGLAIGSRGPVESIRFLSRQPLAELDAVLVDQASRTSVAMLRLLLDRTHRVSPDFFSFRPDPARPFLGPDGLEAPAALLIGDAALDLNPEGAFCDIDLGAWWQSSFHRPFVYALWVTRAPAGSAEHERLCELFTASAALGRRELPLICEEVAEARRWTESRVHEYLTQRIDYRLDDAALDGLAFFRALCLESYLCPDRPAVAATLAALREELARAGSAHSAR